jgi:hypothetical protein
MPVIALHVLGVIHPMSGVADDDAFRPGKIIDSLSGEASETVEVQLLDSHESREFTRRKDYPIEIYPELEQVEVDSPGCLSGNGRVSSIGLYSGRTCSLCPHALRRCVYRRNAWMRYVGTTDEKPRELLFKGLRQSLPAWTEIEFATSNAPENWHIVARLRGAIVKAGPGKAGIWRVEELRPATDAEIEAAGTMCRRVSTMLARLIAGEAELKALAGGGDDNEPDDVEKETPAISAAPAGGNGKGRR